MQRLESSKKRPLLNHTFNKKKTLENIYKARKSLYEKADFIVNNDKDKLQVLNKIKEKLNSNAK